MAEDERPEEERPEGAPPEGEPAADQGSEAPPEPQATQSEASEPEASEGAPEEPEPAAPSGEGTPDPEPAQPPAAKAEEAPAEASGAPVIPGADLEVDIVPEGSDPLAQAQAEAEAAELEEAVEAPPEPEPAPEPEEPAAEPRPRAAIDLGADARYQATGKRKTAIARVILKPGGGAYAVNGHTLEEYFPRATAQRNIREPLETVGYDGRMDVVASLQGGGVSAQAGALRHGIARALLEADPNLRIELKRRGLLTRDARVKERRKAGLKKARKRPQFSKR